jgi:hypothetical protein
MHEADESYMGYFDAANLILLLNALLESERAVARLALAIANEANAGPIAELMQSVHTDEAHCCALLNEHITRLGGMASDKIDSFHEEAMAIVDFRERILFLNRCQSRVVRTLTETLPRVRDDKLRLDLAAMLGTHEANIARANDVADNVASGSA